MTCLDFLKHQQLRTASCMGCRSFRNGRQSKWCPVGSRPMLDEDGSFLGGKMLHRHDLEISNPSTNSAKTSMCHVAMSFETISPPSSILWQSQALRIWSGRSQLDKLLFWACSFACLLRSSAGKPRTPQISCTATCIEAHRAFLFTTAW